MPNWCDNQLFIKGDFVERNRFLELVTNTAEQADERRQEIDILNNLYPCPEELHNTTSGFFGVNEDGTKKQEQIDLEAKQVQNIAKYGAKDWYDWSCNNWGTKWGDNDTYLDLHEEDDVEGGTVFQFTTAWSPPLFGLAHISAMFPKLDFFLTYSEGGMGFYGLCTFVDGEPIDNCLEMMEIEGYSSLDWDDEDAYEKAGDLLEQAKIKLILELA